jgi:hypothetical protein
VWYLPASLAKEKAPKRNELVGRRMMATGNAMSHRRLAGADAQKLTQMESKRDRVINNSRCPGCGSNSYTEKEAPEP